MEPRAPGQVGGPVAKLVYAPDLESGSLHRIAGSSPAGATILMQIAQYATYQIRPLTEKVNMH